MQTSKHTPGPWSNLNAMVMAENNCTMICDPYSGNRQNKGFQGAVSEKLLPIDEREANAQLIAAAPETAAERDRLKASNAELVEAMSLQEKRMISLLKSAQSPQDGYLRLKIEDSILGLRRVLAKHGA